METNENEIKNLDERIFKKAIFETIRLWCFSEYNYSKELIKAFELYDHNIDWSIGKDLDDLYNEFLNDYSIARTRLSNQNEGILKIIFNNLIDEKKFSPEIVDNIAEKIGNAGFTPTHKGQAKPIKPISLVSKTIFLLKPKDAILYDSRGFKSINFILKTVKIENYNDYFYQFEKLKKQYSFIALNIIDEYLPEIKEIMRSYFSQYFLLNKNIDNEGSFNIMEDKEWLYHRSLDKYLWYFYEKYILGKSFLKKINN